MWIYILLFLVLGFNIDIDPKLLKTEYAVRGPVLAIAREIQEKLENNEKLPFDELVYCNIGNPQALGQKPITFYRQVLSSVINPALLSSMPEDVQKRADNLLQSASGKSIGAYTHSQGLVSVRKSVQAFLKERDGYDTNIDNLFLTDGASAGVKMILRTFIFKENHGVLLPIPQYPLYTATLSLLGGKVIPYELVEEKGWILDFDALEKAIEEAKRNGILPRAIVIINPGNPTGQCMTSDQIVSLVKFAEKHNIVIMADEVYQKNVYRSGLEFTAVRKVVLDSKSQVPLVSFHSTSKGLIGECGLRGGFFELLNFPEQVQQQLYKMASISLCPNTMGQIATELMVNPPKKGEASFEEFENEKQAIYDSLKNRAKLVSEKLNEIPGISCQQVEGALYAFPKISLSKEFVEFSKTKNMAPDLLYCIKLVEQTGLVAVPGSGFRQVVGTYHIRLTILPPEDKIGAMLEALKSFHINLGKENFQGKEDL